MSSSVRGLLKTSNNVNYEILKVLIHICPITLLVVLL